MAGPLAELDLFRASDDPDDPRPRTYLLDMFPYPSGDLHMGHAEAYAIADAVARYYFQRQHNQRCSSRTSCGLRSLCRLRSPWGGDRMFCPYCKNAESRVIDSRTADDGAAIRRRRSCPACGRRFTTQETVILMVVRSGATEPFTREKIVRGVRRACQGRPVTEDELAILAQQVEDTIRARGSARSLRTRWDWRFSGRSATWTKWLTCGSPRSTGGLSLAH